MVFPPLTWVLLIVAAALCAIGFIKFVWFMSVGYGLAVGGIGVAVFLIAVIRGDLTPVMAVLCCLLLVYGLRLGLFLLIREMKSAAYRKTLNAQTDKPVPIFVKFFMWIFMAVLYVMEASAVWYREATAPNGPQLTAWIGAAVCRWNYALTEEKRPGEFFPIEEENGFTTVLSSHDLCCIDFLDKLQDAGVSSFKIEGRMKTAYYVATAVNAYRKAIDGTDTIENCREELNALKHRPYSSGFYFGDIAVNHNNDGRYLQTCTFVGNVLGSENGYLKLRQRNHFRLGDTLEALSPNRPTVSFKVTEIRTEAGEKRETAPHPNEILYVPCEYELSAGDFLRRRDDD